MNSNFYQILITDIDNTLYNWIDSFAPAFRAMIHVLHRKTKIDENSLFDSFKKVFKEHKSTQYPFAIQELDVIKELNLTNEELFQEVIKPARTAFSITRNKRLKKNIYPNVRETLKWLKDNGVIIIGLTDASQYQIEKRLKLLHISHFFDYLIAKQNFHISDEDIQLLVDTRGFGKKNSTKDYKNRYKNNLLKSPSAISKKTQISVEQLKPKLYSFELIKIKYNISKDNIYMVGDSISKDIAFAKKLGIKDIWAKYGKAIEKKNIETMNRISYWSDEKKRIEKIMQTELYPSMTINDFAEVRNVFKYVQCSLF